MKKEALMLLSISESRSRCSVHFVLDMTCKLKELLTLYLVLVTGYSY